MLVRFLSVEIQASDRFTLSRENNPSEATIFLPHATKGQTATHLGNAEARLYLTRDHLKEQV